MTTLDLQVTITEICEQYRRRVDLHRAEKQMMLSVYAVCRRLVRVDGMTLKQLNAAASLLVKDVELKRRPKGWAPQHPLGDKAIFQCAVFNECIAIIRPLRKRQERVLESLVQSVPVHDWWVSVNGLSSLGLAILVGEARDIGAYRAPRYLWKRMGVAVIDGEIQRRTRDAEKAERFGYSPPRRSALWTIGDSLIKKQNPYRELYLARKAERAEEKTDWTPLHIHNDAKRYMEKRLLVDVWAQWQAATGAA